VQKLTGLRHKYPILRRNRFLTGAYNEELGVKDVMWINADGAEMKDANWGDAGMRCFGMLMDGRAQTTGIRQRGHDATLLLVINDHFDMVNFTMPECVGGCQWRLLFDTNLETIAKKNSAKLPEYNPGDQYEVTARSLLLFVMEADA
jgi:isoamylase